MTIIYQMTDEDVAAGSSLWRRSRLKWYQVLLFTLLTGVTIFFVLVEDDVVSAAVKAAIFAIIIVAIFHLLQKYSSRRKSLKYFHKTPSNHKPCEIAWDEDYLRISSENGFVKLPWKELKAWAEDKSLLVLIHHGPLFTPLPKRLLSEQQQAEIRRCLAAAAVSKARLFPL